MANVIEGEAPETDEELLDEQEEKEERGAAGQPPKKSVHVDERVQQHWRHLSQDSQTVLWRRSQPFVKSLAEQKDLAHKTFDTTAASSLRTASVRINQAEDGLLDIKEAADLLPEKTQFLGPKCTHFSGIYCCVQLLERALCAPIQRIGGNQLP